MCWASTSKKAPRRQQARWLGRHRPSLDPICLLLPQWPCQPIAYLSGHSCVHARVHSFITYVLGIYYEPGPFLNTVLQE